MNLPRASTPDESHVPIAGYDQLSDREVGDRLSQLSQVELAAVETMSALDGNRPAVLDKLRYMHDTEPLPGYDTLTPEQIAEALADADAETVGPCATTSASSTSAARCR